MTFELYQDGDAAWRWRLRDDDGKTIAMSFEPQANKKYVYSTIDAILNMDKADIVNVRS